MKPILRVRNISKRYVLGSEVDHTQSFREMLSGLLLSPLQRFRRLSGTNAKGETFWALNNISFSINPGEILGVIGANGAGKSTLLKVLSRVTSPTEGQVTYQGRLASLLEVGTGFHPELTGRENIYLNGAILGMRREEIAARFDRIVQFANVEQFLDTPVKRYSSGMYVRLAFSVAAHIEPEILIIDEVLAVGDTEFQKKCLELMKTLSENGHAVIFVSHNMDSVRALTSRCIMLENGKLEMDGSTHAVIEHYQQRNKSAFGVVHEDKNKIDILNFSASIKTVDKHSCNIEIDIQLRSKANLTDVKIDFAIENDRNVRIIQNIATQDQFVNVNAGQTINANYSVKVTSLLHGDYTGVLYIFNRQFGALKHVEGTKLFNVPTNPTEVYSESFTPVLVPQINASLNVDH